MASLGNPRTWIPYMNNKDCSQGFCSLYCPQWCYGVYPPPPPPYEFPEEDSGPNFSPLVITIIGILASAFLLVSYYTVISKYCGNRESARRGNRDPNGELEDNHNPSLHEPWHVPTTGLDDALIKSITVCKYKIGDGLLGVADCSVCLSEFQEGESLRLLPKCSHAFHLPCIDTWLKSHSNCPLCRASIFTFNPSAPQVAVPVIELSSRSEASTENQRVVSGRDNGRSSVEEVIPTAEAPKHALRAYSDLSSRQGRHSIIDIRYEGYDSMRRSISMDHSFQSGLSAADVLHMNQDQDTLAEECSAEAGSSKRSRGESSKSSCKRKVLHCVLSPIAMKRSFSSGRFSFSRNARGRQGIIPV